jgi:hypothetical protein
LENSLKERVYSELLLEQSLAQNVALLQPPLLKPECYFETRQGAQSRIVNIGLELPDSPKTK